MRFITCIVFISIFSGVVCDCGKRELLVSGKIVGGRNAFKNEFPWNVALGFLNENNYFVHFCGGSVIDKRWIITAAHCVRGLRASEFSALIGETNLNNVPKESFITNIVTVVIHEKYESKTYENDIALLLTERPIPINGKNINSICLPNQNEIYSGNILVSGWGRINETEKTSDDLKVVEVNIYNDSYCDFAYRKYNKFYEKIMFCAGDRKTNSDSCKGDSGGPAEKITDKGVILVGIVSFGEGCGREHFPGVYTEVSYFVDWIQEVINSELKTIDDIQDFQTCGKQTKANPQFHRFNIKHRRQSSKITNEFPWNVALQVMKINELQYKFICSGIILNEYWILTAASCVHRERLILMRVVFGATRISDVGMTSIVGLRKAFIHRRFNNKTNENDIALLRTLHSMKLRANSAPFINSLCLPKDNNMTYNSELTVSGWDLIKPRDYSSERVMKTFSIKIFDESECKRKYSNVSRIFRAYSMLCARFPSNIQNCDGYKGSALQISVNKQQYLAAIVAVCDTSKAIITKIAPYIPWIIDTITFEERNRRKL